jgi:2,3-bisphosphoglycerate-dependent phosphoglycerate mutase
MSEARLLLVRHGETPWNRERRMQGHVNTALTGTGRAQAEALGRRLAGERLDAVYSSDLRRALETAHAIVACTGHEVVPEPRLRERRFGIFEGLTREDIAARHPREFERFESRDPDFEMQGGESARAFQARALTCLSGIGERHAGRTVLVITHGLVLDTVYRAACALPHDAPRGVPLLNASLNIFGYLGGRWRLECWGDVGHLEPVARDL